MKEITRISLASLPYNVEIEAKKELEKYLHAVEHSLGADADAMKEIPVISTGALSLDLALGVGGVPRGRIIEIYGPESSGKTTLTLHIVAEAQKLGGMAAFIDAEHALDPSYARRLGVNIDELLVSQPDNGEQALEIAEALVRSNALDVIVIDSVAALVPKSEIEGDMGQATMGVQARLMSQALRKLTGAIHKTNTVVIFINQIRMKIGVMFGSPETTTGGNALKFYASVRMDIRRVESITKGEETIGNHVRVKVVKNKVAPPFRKAEFDIFFNHGISRESSIIEEAVNVGVLNKSGTWFSYNDNRLGQGKENVRQYLVENPKICDELEAKVRQAHADGTAKKLLAEKEKLSKGGKAAAAAEEVA